MKTEKDPTQSQFLGLWRTAKDQGLTREMITSLVDDGSFARLMKERRNQVLADRDNCPTFELKATVCQNRSYLEALLAGAPDTPDGHIARKVGDLYPPVSDQEEEVEFVLRNFPKGDGSWDNALAWAKSEGYKITNPREAFAVTEQHDLPELLGHNWLYLVATTECSFEGGQKTICVYVEGLNRYANLSMLEGFGDSNDWFLFRK